MNIIAGLILLGSFLGMATGWISSRIVKGHNHRGEEVIFIATTGLLLGSVSSVLVEHVVERDFTFFLFLGTGSFISWFLAKGDKPSNPCCTPCLDHPTLNVLTIISVSFCSLNDGLFIGLIQPGVFSLLFLSMIMHKFTVSFLLIHLIRLSNINLIWKGLLILVFLILSPIVIYLAGWMVKTNSLVETPLLGASSGVLVYVMVSGLWPTLKHYHRSGKMSPVFFYGLFIAAFLIGGTHFFVHVPHS